MLPKSRPQMTKEKILEAIEQYNIDREKYPIVVVGIRGYYKQTMGDPTKNDRGIYDDAIFLLTNNIFKSFNANTDPSKYRKGYGKSEDTKGIASLNPGIYYSYSFDLHRSKYLALCQIKNEVTVTRDGEPDYLDTGYFGINIHYGGNTTTSSLGCQTIPPSQWDDFIDTVVSEAKLENGEHWRSMTIPYVLLEN